MSYDYSINKTYLPQLRDLADAAVLGQARHLVSTPLNEWGQSPLSLAIALRADDLARQILDCLVAEDMPHLFKCVDKGYWTALEHAAIRRETNFYARLKGLCGPGKQYKETIALSASFLRKIAGCSRKAFTDRDFFFNIGVNEAEGEEEIKMLDGEQVLRQFPFSAKARPTHLSYFPHAQPQILFEMWNAVAVKGILEVPYCIVSEEDQVAYCEFVARVYQTRRIAEIALKVITQDDLNRPVNVGAGIVAVNTIPAGQIFMEYGGEYVKEEHTSDSFYKFELMAGAFALDGMHHRAPGAMINHGFPNAKVVKILLPGRFTLAVKSLAPIQAGEQVRITYGVDNHQFCEKPVELGPKALREFLKAHPPIHLGYAHSLEELGPTDLRVSHCWGYLLRDSGLYFLKCLLKGRISAAQGLFLYTKMLQILESGNTLPLMEKWRWRNLIDPFFDQVPQELFVQALRTLNCHPEKGPAMAKQLKGMGHKIPKAFRFTT